MWADLIIHLWPKQMCWIIWASKLSGFDLFGFGEKKGQKEGRQELSSANIYWVLTLSWSIRDMKEWKLGSVGTNGPSFRTGTGTAPTRLTRRRGNTGGSQKQGHSRPERKVQGGQHRTVITNEPLSICKRMTLSLMLLLQGKFYIQPLCSRQTLATPSKQQQTSDAPFDP